jgi:phospholipase C
MGGFTTVFTIVLENHSYDQVIGSADAPYINSLASKYGLATNYMDSGHHPSLRNYLYLVSGDVQYSLCIDENPDWIGLPGFPVDKPNLGGQMEQAGIKWRSYQEGMGTPCNLDTSGDYAPKHDPFLYFSDIQNGPNGLCAARNVDYSEFYGDLATGQYQYMWITPTLINDGHDPTSDPSQGLIQADAWLSQEIPKIMASEAYQKGGVIFITWDEGGNFNLLTCSADDHVAMIVISPKLKAPGMKVNTALSHASYLATMEDLYGFTRLGDAVGANTLFEFFQ